MAKIVVIDDEADVVFLMRKILEKMGHEVIPAYSGEEGLEKVIAEKPDLVILDLMMPGIDGYEVLERIRKNPETEKIPVIIVSAKNNEEDIVRGIKLGANDYFSKPFNEKILLTKIDSILHMKELEKKLEKAHKELIKQHKSLEEEYKKLKDEISKVKFIKPEKVEDREGISDILGDFSLVEYDPKENFEGMIVSLINDYLAKGKNVLLVSSQPRTNMFYKIFKDGVKGGLLKLIDMPRTKREFGGKNPGILEIPMTSLEYFSAVLDNIPKESVIIFSTLSKLIKNLDEKSVYEFLVRLIDALCDRDVSFVALVNRDAHSPDEIAGLEELFPSIARFERGKLNKVK